MVYSTSENLIRHVSLRQLQIFEAVVRLGGYTRAAQTLHLTQPTVSMQIKKLSEALGLPLLEQVGRQAHPTAAGRDVYTAAKEILDKMVALCESTSELEGVVKGELRIAVITTAKYFMPHLLGAFVAQYPLVKPRLAVTNRTKALTRLKANEDDLLIMLSGLGAVQMRIEVESARNATIYGDLDTEISRQVDVDLAESLVELGRVETAYQAALQSSARIMNLSLFDYL